MCNRNDKHLGLKSFWKRSYTFRNVPVFYDVGSSAISPPRQWLELLYHIVWRNNAMLIGEKLIVLATLRKPPSDVSFQWLCEGWAESLPGWTFRRLCRWGACSVQTGAPQSQQDQLWSLQRQHGLWPWPGTGPQTLRPLQVQRLGTQLLTNASFLLLTQNTSKVFRDYVCCIYLVRRVQCFLISLSFFFYFFRKVNPSLGLKDLWRCIWWLTIQRYVMYQYRCYVFCLVSWQPLLVANLCVFVVFSVQTIWKQNPRSNAGNCQSCW